jgi:hypothetical protein
MPNLISSCPFKSDLEYVFKSIDLEVILPTENMPTSKWMEISPSYVSISELIATQHGVYFHALYDTVESYSGDPLPHVVSWNGKLYLEDGHSRATRAMMRGWNLLQVRVLEIR